MSVANCRKPASASTRSLTHLELISFTILHWRTQRCTFGPNVVRYGVGFTSPEDRLSLLELTRTACRRSRTRCKQPKEKEHGVSSQRRNDFSKSTAIITIHSNIESIELESI
jgi:hypothetical protein